MAGKLKPHERRELKKQHLYRPERKPRAMLPERHLFVTEGTKTEPNYLEGIIRQIETVRGPGIRRQFQIIGEGRNTLNLLARAEQHLQNSSDGFQHVWILYDQDDFPEDRFDNTVSRCDALNKRFQRVERNLTFHAIWSNECIELWFLLHFMYLDANVPREQYRSILSEQLGRHYEKADDALFDTLFPRLPTALQNAHRLASHHGEDVPPSHRAPCTMVYELIEALMPYFHTP